MIAKMIRVMGVAVSISLGLFFVGVSVLYAGFFADPRRENMPLFWAFIGATLLYFTSIAISFAVWRNPGARIPLSIVMTVASTSALAADYNLAGKVGAVIIRNAALEMVPLAFLVSWVFLRSPDRDSTLAPPASPAGQE